LAIILGIFLIFIPRDRFKINNQREGYKWRRSAFLIISLIIFIISSILLILPFKESHISGYLDSGAMYEKTWITLFSGVLSGYQIFLASLIIFFFSYQYFEGKAGNREFLFWSLVAFFLVEMSFISGKTPIFAWNPSIPVGVQSAIGTKYTVLKENIFENYYLRASIYGIVAFTALSFINFVIFTKNIWKKKK
ncbi:MAG: hypothetical protein KAS39_04735, partial [Actinomycetia bacterium]|nr:hypothetical protein [Actinomycetes bacterium]